MARILKNAFTASKGTLGSLGFVAALATTSATGLFAGDKNDASALPDAIPCKLSEHRGPATECNGKTVDAFYIGFSPGSSRLNNSEIAQIRDFTATRADKKFTIKASAAFCANAQAAKNYGTADNLYATDSLAHDRAKAAASALEEGGISTNNIEIRTAATKIDCDNTYQYRSRQTVIFANEL